MDFFSCTPHHPLFKTSWILQGIEHWAIDSFQVWRLWVFWALYAVTLGFLFVCLFWMIFIYFTFKIESA
jgi:hypothetical protein